VTRIGRRPAVHRGRFRRSSWRRATKSPTARRGLALDGEDPRAIGVGGRQRPARRGSRASIHVLRFMSCRWFRGLPAADERGIPGATFSRSRPRDATPPTAARCAKCLTAPAPNAAPSLRGRARSWSCRAMENGWEIQPPPSAFAASKIPPRFWVASASSLPPGKLLELGCTRAETGT